MTFPFTIVCAYQELFDAVTSTGKNYNVAMLNDILVALFNSFFSLGLIIGPLASSYITLATNFRICTDYEALAMAAFAIIFICAVFIPTQLKKKKKVYTKPIGQITEL